MQLCTQNILAAKGGCICTPLTPPKSATGTSLVPRPGERGYLGTGLIPAYRCHENSAVCTPDPIERLRVTSQGAWLPLILMLQSCKFLKIILEAQVTQICSMDILRLTIDFIKMSKVWSLCMKFYGAWQLLAMRHSTPYLRTKLWRMAKY